MIDPDLRAGFHWVGEMALAFGSTPPVSSMTFLAINEL